MTYSLNDRVRISTNARRYYSVNGRSGVIVSINKYRGKCTLLVKYADNSFIRLPVSMVVPESSIN